MTHPENGKPARPKVWVIDTEQIKPVATVIRKPLVRSLMTSRRTVCYEIYSFPINYRCGCIEPEVNCNGEHSLVFCLELFSTIEVFIDGRKIFEPVLVKLIGKLWTGSSGRGQRPVAGSCERGHERRRVS
jgi:hypothetical protein